MRGGTRAAAALAVLAVLLAAAAPAAGQPPPPAAAAQAAPANATDLHARARRVRKGGKLRIHGVKGLPSSASSLDLERFEPFAPGAKVVVKADPNSPPLVRAPPNNTYFRGSVSGSPESTVMLVVDASGGMSGEVRSGKQRWRLHKGRPGAGNTTAAPSGRRELKATDAAAPASNATSNTTADALLAATPITAAPTVRTFKCGYDGSCTPKPYPVIDPNSELASNKTLMAEYGEFLARDGNPLRTRIEVEGVDDNFNPFDPQTQARKLLQATSPTVIDQPYQATIAFDGDVLFYSRFSSVDEAVSYLAMIVGLADVVYSREVGLDIVMGFVRIWTGKDPYNAQQSDSAKLLKAVGDEWNANMQDIPRTLTFLASGASLMIGGLAWLGVPCSWADNPSVNLGYAMCAGFGGTDGWSKISWDGNQTNNPADIYWDSLCFAHEIGHNFGAPHTHGMCNIGGDKNNIDNCEHSDNGCPETNYGQLPTCTSPSPFFRGSGVGAGTIMSYCHNVPGPNGFSFGNTAWTLGGGQPTAQLPNNRPHTCGNKPERMPELIRKNIMTRAESYKGQKICLKGLAPPVLRPPPPPPSPRAPRPPPSGPAVIPTGRKTAPFIVPTEIPWLSDSYIFGNGTYDHLPTGVTLCDGLNKYYKGYIFKWYCDMPGIVTLSTCEYTSADTSIVVYRADGDVPVLNNSAACMGVGSDNGYCGSCPYAPNPTKIDFAAEANKTYFITVAVPRPDAWGNNGYEASSFRLAVFYKNPTGVIKLPPSPPMPPSPPAPPPAPPPSPPPPPYPPGVAFSVTVGDNQVATLACGNGRAITAIPHATWGCPSNTTVLNPASISELSACIGKLTCTYTPSYTKLGDPCPGAYKTFLATFTCTPPPPAPPPSPPSPPPNPPPPPFPPGAAFEATCHDLETCQLSCPGQFVTAVHSAIWACADNRACDCNGGCCPIDLSSDVRNSCVGRSSCGYYVAWDQQGDSCPGDEKTLAIVYSCGTMPPPPSPPNPPPPSPPSPPPSPPFPPSPPAPPPSPPLNPGSLANPIIVDSLPFRSRPMNFATDLWPLVVPKAGAYMNTSWRAAVFKFKSPGAGSVALSTCGYTTQNTVWEVYSSTDGTLRSSTAKHVAGKDEGCDVPGPTEGSVSGIKQGVTYFFLVGTYDNTMPDAPFSLKVMGQLTTYSPPPPSPPPLPPSPRPPPRPPRPPPSPPVPPLPAEAVDNLGYFMMLMPDKNPTDVTRTWCINACEDASLCSSEQFLTDDVRSVYAFMYCSKTDPSIRSLWQATTRTSDGNGTWYQITSLASGGCLAAIKDSLYVQANYKTYRMLVTECNNPQIWDPATNNQLWQFRVPPRTGGRVVLVTSGADPYGTVGREGERSVPHRHMRSGPRRNGVVVLPCCACNTCTTPRALGQRNSLPSLGSDPPPLCLNCAGNEPQCASSCWDPADPVCAITGYFPPAKGKTDASRLMFAEICDDYFPAIPQGYDPYETLTLFPVSQLPLSPPPAPPSPPPAMPPPSPPPRPPPPPPPPPLHEFGTFMLLMPNKGSTWCAYACDNNSTCSAENLGMPDARAAFAYSKCNKASPSVLAMWQAAPRAFDGNGTWYHIVSMASGGCLTINVARPYSNYGFPSYRVLVTRCNNRAAWDPQTNPQMWQFRVDPKNAARYVLVPGFPAYDGSDPQCLTSCASSSDLDCARSGYYGLANTTATLTDARHLLTEICEQYTQTNGYDPFESLTVYPVSGPPAPPQSPPPPPFSPPPPPSPPSPPAAGLEVDPSPPPPLLDSPPPAPADSNPTPPSPQPPSPSPPPSPTSPSPQPPSPSPPPSPKPPSPQPPSPKPPSPQPPSPTPPSPLPQPPSPFPAPPPSKSPPPPTKAPPPPPQTPLGLSYTVLRGSFGGTYPTHQASKVVERGTLARLGSGYSCDPLLPSTAAQACLSTKYKTKFAVRATGNLQVLPTDAKRSVQLLLKATGWARITLAGKTVTITGAPTSQSQTLSVTLAAGLHPIVVEWMQESGTAKIQVMWKTGAALAWSSPRLVTPPV